MPDKVVSLEAKISTAVASTAIIAGVANKRIRVYMLFWVQSDNANITIQSGSTALTGALPLTAFGTFFMPYSIQPWFTTVPGDDFRLVQDATAQISGRVYYSQE